MQLLWNGGRALASPREITEDDAGARQLADLYATDPGRPGIRAMMNATIDGAIIGDDGTSGPLRNPTDSFVFSVLRAVTDVVLVGAETVRVEDYRRPRGRRDLLEPSLRPSGAARPALAIMSRTGELPDSIRADWPTLLVTGAAHREQAIERSGLPEQNVISAEDPTAIRRALTERGYRAIQLEGGTTSLARFAAAGELDELCFSTTHRTLGGHSPRVLQGEASRTDWELDLLAVGGHATITRYRRAAGLP
ncbi:pyrimidine reductase [Brachybacterium endophyticum]|uniref:Pyrimidine reductase n=1 Tax=Brachybacterium endophyticum TaxID=2182385 RepID=A0A2U2RJ90_9MICO|nr:dihydrofolate reductase family protein [Brachybacterium endophyticum]PWH05901.1 pyrimidine reductase [Brachybacterium endophyticum]